jgi:hypothetical protein
MTYTVIGFMLALGMTLLAWQRSRAYGGFYDSGIYGMKPRAHARYALVSLCFMLLFVLAYALRSEAAGIAGLALYAFIAIFYAASFLQGAHDPDD